MNTRTARTLGARLPAESLAPLADLRRAAEIRLVAVGSYLWLTWPTSDETTTRCVMALPGAVLYEARGAYWYRRGNRLPAFDVAFGRGGDVALYQALVPSPVEHLAPPCAPLSRVRLTLRRDARFRPTTALRCGIGAMAGWADTTPTSELARFQAACRNGRILLLGPSPPPLTPARRFWGDRLLVPLGFRPEPAMPEAVLRAACGIAATELLILDPDDHEVVPLEAFATLTRAGVRLAAREIAR
jgi:hypothetical protein